MILYILLAYVANVFLARQLNYWADRISKGWTPVPVLWFIPIMGPLICFIVFCIAVSQWSIEANSGNKYWNWFRGSHWLLILALLAAWQNHIHIQGP